MTDWQALRLTVFTRDGGCIAVRGDVFSDPTTEPCRDRWGSVIQPTDWTALEFDHVKPLGGGHKAPDDDAHGVAACPQHHRLSTTWRTDSSEHREAIRAYLTRLYPEVWT
jgi:5-methylcytosine-specific restriction endonuclease McrA